jgi:uncharacterized SAM-dependent methyltransferase
MEMFIETKLVTNDFFSATLKSEKFKKVFKKCEIAESIMTLTEGAIIKMHGKPIGSIIQISNSYDLTANGRKIFMRLSTFEKKYDDQYRDFVKILKEHNFEKI